MRCIKPIIGFLLLGSMTFLLFGCEKSPSEACDSLQKEGVASKSQLVGEWEFKSFEKMGGVFSKEEVPPDEFRAIKITFTDTNFFRIIAPINVCGGDYIIQQTSQNLTLQLSGCTEKGGGTEEENEWEERIKSALKNVKCFSIQGGKQLQIYFDNANKKNLMNFTK